MELTLRLPRAEAALLQRLPIVRSTRTGRARGATVRIVWHDSLDRKLSTQGLALAEQRGTWRLERHQPKLSEAWPPATDHRVIEEAAALEGLSSPLPEAKTPVAAFEGRTTLFPLGIDGESVSMTLLDGTIRAVAAEKPATRLILEGPDTAVRKLAMAAAETLAISIPEQSLATEALHLADGTAPIPRRSGPPVLPAEETSVYAAFSHIIGHLADVIVYLAPAAADPEAGPDPVHDMRVAVRRARSALALFLPVAESPSLARASDGLRTLGHVLGPARDWDVFMTETAPPVEAVLPDKTGLQSLLRAGTRRRHAARTALAAWLAGAEYRSLSLELACLAAAGPPVPEVAPPLIEFAAATLQSRRKKLLNAGKSLEELDDPALHGLRLKAKRLRYAAEFFAPLFPEKPVARFIRRLAVLQDRLGVFNDTTVAEGLLRELSGSPGFAAGLVLGFTAARGAGVRPRIASAWARFRRREPFWE